MILIISHDSTLVQETILDSVPLKLSYRFMSGRLLTETERNMYDLSLALMDIFSRMFHCVCLVSTVKKGINNLS